MRCIIALPLLLCTSCSGTDSRANSLDSKITSIMGENHIPGAQVASSRVGETLLDGSYGKSNLLTDRSVMQKTCFEIGSITKQFTAAAILQLEERGKLRLADPLSKYVPEYGAAKDVTVEQLLWQVSGIPEYMDEPNIEDIASRQPGGLESAFALIKDRPLDFEPGTRWEYSNTNYLLLGAIVTRAAGLSWEVYLKRNIFPRAGMTESRFIGDEPSMADMATGYTGKEGEMRPAPVLKSEWAGGVGAIVSTANDVLK